MKALVAFALLVGSLLQAQTPYIPPDGHGAAFSKSVAFWKNQGQLIDTNGDTVPQIAYYTEGGVPCAYIGDDARK